MTRGISEEESRDERLGSVILAKHQRELEFGHRTRQRFTTRNVIHELPVILL